MGANIKALRTRIKSVDSTLHLTKAMGLVASSKIRRANEGMFRSREYVAAVEKAISLLTASTECRKSPYMRSLPEKNTRSRVIVIAGDRGLAGGYNANIFRLIRDTLDEDAMIIPIGKRACERFASPVNSSENYSYEQAWELAKVQCRDFSEGKFDRLGIVSTRYVSMMSQQPILHWVLPLDVTENNSRTGVIFEPDERTILDAAVPEYVTGCLVAALRESFACEVAARRMAMDSAGKNAQTMIDDLQLQYNRARQGAITQEITEIVAGS